MRNKFVFQIFAFATIAYCSISCKQTVGESLLISIQNRTDSIIHIRLYPKAEYASGSLYFHSDMGSGKWDSKFSLNPNHIDGFYWKEVIFFTSNLCIDPFELTANVFDSIYIEVTSKENLILKFAPDSVTQYSENLFSENSTWDYKTVDISRPTQHAPNPGIGYCYSFLILNEKIIIIE